MAESDRFSQLDFSPIRPYLERLLTAYPTIESVWLIGSRANETARDDSDWDLLVFGSREVLDTLSKDDSFSRSDVDLLVVYDGDNFESPYGGIDNRKSKKGSLRKWEWRHFSPDLASYEACKLGEGLHIDIERRSGIKIWPNEALAFHSYMGDYPKVLQVIHQSLTKTSLRDLEVLTIRLMHALESNLLKSPDEESKDFFVTVMSKLVNECIGFIGCLQAGADSATFHHSRAAWELYAALNYALGDERQRFKRVRRFNEFHSLQKYNHYNERMDKLRSSSITQEQFDRTCHVSSEAFEILKKKVPDWCRIWKVRREELVGIHHWHGRTSIEDMFKSLKDEPDAWSLYEFYCHGAHLSPSARGMTDGIRLIGFPRLQNGSVNVQPIENQICNMILVLQRVSLFLSKNTGSPAISEIINHEVTVLYKGIPS
jgi:predicted nucleotidyltransferase